MEFSDHINIVQGNNESGKSTLVKFIANIFYGASKTKKGKEFSDYDQYKPWEQEEFSGKLAYTLEDGTYYEVFRDFHKKNPTIYNEQLEDISKQFTMDKTYGNQFFVDQTKVEESMFYSTFVSMQQEVKLEQNIQNAMVQKVANLAGTGDDSISYQKAMQKLNKKQIEEIGTTRSQGRPMNVIKEEKFALQDEIGRLEEYKQRKQEIIQEKETEKQELQKIEEDLEIIRKVKDLKEKQELEKEKIKISEDLKQTQEQKKQELEKQEEELTKQLQSFEQESLPKKKNLKIRSAFLSVLSILLEIFLLLFVKNYIVIILLSSIFLLGGIGSLVVFYQQKQQESQKRKEEQKQQKQKEEIKQKIEEIQTQEKVLQNSIEEQERNIKQKKEYFLEKEAKEKEELRKTAEDTNRLHALLEIEELSGILKKQEEEKNRKSLAYHSLELEEKTIKPKLEEQALLEEQWETLQEQETQLEQKNQEIELAKEILEKAYQKMKQNVTPKLTQVLSNHIAKITNGKYKKVSLNEQKGLMVEKENGDYIEAERLSIRNNRPTLFVFTFSHGRTNNRRNYAHCTR